MCSACENRRVLGPVLWEAARGGLERGLRSPGTCPRSELSLKVT